VRQEVETAYLHTAKASRQWQEVSPHDRGKKADGTYKDREYTAQCLEQKQIGESCKQAKTPFDWTRVDAPSLVVDDSQILAMRKKVRIARNGKCARYEWKVEAWSVDPKRYEAVPMGDGDLDYDFGYIRWDMAVVAAMERWRDVDLDQGHSHVLTSKVRGVREGRVMGDVEPAGLGRHVPADWESDSTVAFRAAAYDDYTVSKALLGDTNHMARVGEAFFAHLYVLEVGILVDLSESCLGDLEGGGHRVLPNRHDGESPDWRPHMQKRAVYFESVSTRRLGPNRCRCSFA
jgi:hypothetical protein